MGAGRQSQLHGIVVAAFIPEPRAFDAGRSKARHAVEVEARHTEQARLEGVETEIEVDARQAQRIVDVAHARNGDQRRFDVAGQRGQRREVGADHAHRDRGLDRRAVLELRHGDPRVGICRETPAQVFQQGLGAGAVPAIERDEHLADRGLRLLGELVVVDQRVAAAEVRHAVDHARRPGQHAIDEAQGAIGRDERGAFRGVDLDEELRLVGGREQREAEEGHESQRRDEQRGAEQQRPPRGGQRLGQHRGVHAVDGRLQATQQGIALAVRFARQETAGEEGHHGECHQQRGRHGHHHGQRQAARELAGPFGQVEQRQEGEDQYRRGAEDGQRDLPRAIDGGAHAVGAFTQVPRDVLDHDDGVVDQQAERDDEARDRNLVQREAEEPQRGHAHGQRQRDGDHDDAGGAEPEGEQGDRDQCERDAEVEAKAAQAMGDVVGLFEADLEADARGQGGAKLGQPPVEPGLHVEDAEAVLHVGGDEGRALAVVAREVGRFLGGPSHVGDVAEQHGAPVACRDHRVRDGLDAGVVAGALEVVAALADVDRAAGNACALAGHRGIDRGHVDAQRGHARQIERGANFRCGKAPGLRAADAGHAFQRFLEIVGQLLEVPTVEGRCDQRDLQDVHEAGVGLAEGDVTHARRQRSAECVHLADHLVVFVVRRHRPLEFDLDHAQPALAGGADLLDVLQFGERVFDRVDGEALDVHRIGAGIHDHHRGERNREGGVLLARDGGHGEGAQGHEQEQGDAGELPALDGEGPGAHGAPSLRVETGVPSAR